jgi:hypothetical protein
MYPYETEMECCKNCNKIIKIMTLQNLILNALHTHDSVISVIVIFSEFMVDNLILSLTYFTFYLR